MTTHRSLNKLEFKAHMSIHNKVEVSEAQIQGSHTTRDRFGKKQSVTPAREKRRRSAKKILIIAIVLASALTGVVSVQAGSRNTDVRIESAPLDVLLDRQINVPEDRFAIPLDDSKELGLNENGDPNLNVRF